MNIFEILSEPRAFVPYWFQQKQLRVQGNLILDTKNKSFDLSWVLLGSWLDYGGELRRFNAESDRGDRVKGFPEKDLVKAIEEYLIVKKQEALKEIMLEIECKNENLDELRRFLMATTGKCDEVELAVLAHMIWQVKRKISNRKVYEHQMVIFRGAQGIGKTEAIRKIFKPLLGWFKSASLSEITDDRWKLFLREGFVVFCDELQYAERTSVDALKNIISAETFETRKLGTNIYVNVTQSCTFIGATNRSVSEMIRDSTGMRRFFEIESLQRMDWEMLNSIDALKIWQGIDESREKLYIAPYKSEISLRQEKLILPDSDEEFLEHFQLLKGDRESMTEFLPNADLYATYCVYAKKNGERQKASNVFHRRIKNNGLKDLADRQGHNGDKGYRVTKVALDLVQKYRKENFSF
jgi:predicted P-loop ATPase